MADTIPSTMGEFIDTIEDMDISYRVLHDRCAIYTPKRKRIATISLTSLVNKYRDALKSIIIELELDDVEQARYMYQPKTVSEEVYGTTEFWDIILVLNGFKSISTFVPKTLKLYDPDKLKSYINEIMLIENIE